MTEIVKPDFPPGVSVKFLASAGLTELELENICVEQVGVLGIDSLVNDTVKVKYNEVEYSNIPVWIHTDEGCYANRYKASLLGTPEEAAIFEDGLDPTEYFKGGARHFIATEDTGLVPWDDVSKEWKPPGDEIYVSTPPSAYALIHRGEPETGSKVLGVIKVKEHAFRTDDHRTYKLYVGVQHKTITGYPQYYTNEVVYLIDPVDGGYAQIPNADFSEIVDADFASTWEDYKHIIESDGVAYPGALRLTIDELRRYGNLVMNGQSATIFNKSIMGIAGLGDDTWCRPEGNPASSDNWTGTYGTFPDPAYDLTSTCTSSYSWQEATVVSGGSYTKLDASERTYHTWVVQETGLRDFFFGNKTYAITFEDVAQSFTFTIDSSFAWELDIEWHIDTEYPYGVAKTAIDNHRAISLTVNGVGYAVEFDRSSEQDTTGTNQYLTAPFLSRHSPFAFVSAPNYLYDFSFFSLYLQKEGDWPNNEDGEFIKAWHYDDDLHDSISPLSTLQKNAFQDKMMSTIQDFWDNHITRPVGDYTIEFSLIAVPFDFRTLDIGVTP